MIQLRTLGTTDLRTGPGDEVRAVLAQPKRLALLAYLAIARPRGFHRKDTLRALFWPEADDHHARLDLNRAVYFLRHALGENVIVAGPGEALGISPDTLRCDAVAFGEAVDSGRFEDALRLYRGDLLAGFFASVAPEFEHWLDHEREHLRRQTVEAALALTGRDEAVGDALGAARWAARAVEISPFEERAVRCLIRNLDRSGDRGAAVHAYEEFAERLRRTLELEPGPETRALVAAVKDRGTPVPDPADRFPTAAPFAEALPLPGTVTRGPGDRARSRRRVFLSVAGALLAVVMIAAGTRLGWVPWGRAAAVAPAPNSVAVLDFSNLSPDTADAYLADGLTEELIVRLGQMERLQIKSRAAVQRYSRSGVDPVAAGHALRVGHLVSGTVRRAGDRLRVTVELVRLPSGDRLWGERYDRSGVEVWAIQEDIARSVATAVAGRLAPAERARLGRRPTASLEAYDHYLRANYYLSQRSRRALTRAAEEYAAAVRIDARFTAALARLAYVHALFIDWQFDYAGLSPDRLLARGLAASDRALQQDSSASEAWMARGYLLTFDRPRTFAGATAAFARAIALDSANAEAHHQFGWVLAQLARDSATVAAYHRALALEPERAITLHHLALLRTMQRRFGEARRWLDSTLAVSPGFVAAYSDRARVHLLLGELNQARADAETALRLSPPGSRLWAEATMALVEAREGNVRGAVERVETFVREVGAYSTVTADYLDVAGALATAGDHDRALAIVERVRPRGPRLWSTLRRPELDPIRSHPRFQRVLEESRPPGAAALVGRKGPPR